MKPIDVRDNYYAEYNENSMELHSMKLHSNKKILNLKLVRMLEF